MPLPARIDPISLIIILFILFMIIMVVFAVLNTTFSQMTLQSTNITIAEKESLHENYYTITSPDGTQYCCRKQKCDYMNIGQTYTLDVYRNQFTHEMYIDNGAFGTEITSCRGGI